MNREMLKSSLDTGWLCPEGHMYGLESGSHPLFLARIAKITWAGAMRESWIHVGGYDDGTHWRQISLVDGLFCFEPDRITNFQRGGLAKIGFDPEDNRVGRDSSIRFEQVYPGKDPYGAHPLLNMAELEARRRLRQITESSDEVTFIPTGAPAVNL